MTKIISLSKIKEKNTNIISAVFMTEGNLVPLKVSEKDHKANYLKALEIISESKDGSSFNAKELLMALSPKARVSEAIKDSFYLSKELSIVDGSIYFAGERLEDTLASHILSLLDEEKVPKNETLWRSYIKFLDNLHQNVNEEIRKQLFRWMDYEEKAGHPFAITEDGCLVGYKGCRGTVLEPVSSFVGNAIVNGEEINGHIPNKVGSVISMPRSAVQYDPSIGCSTGLHVGTRDYAVNWAPILLLVKVNPRDVVSVPYECESQKMRVCEYTVLEVIDASDEHKMLFTSELYEEDWEDDCENECEIDCQDCSDCSENFEEDWEDWEDWEDEKYSKNENICENECLCASKTGTFKDFISCLITESECLSKLDRSQIEKYSEERNYITVTYQKNGLNKQFSGEVVDFYFVPGKKVGLIMKKENVYKHIKIDSILEVFFK